MTNRSYLEKISRLVDIDGKDVIEIGPGSGRMTSYLLERCKSLTCVEIDPRMCDLLREKFSGSSNIKIVNEDILDFSLPEGARGLVLYGNIPYSISKKIVEYIIVNRARIGHAYILCQKEFAAKLTALPGGDAYGYLACVLAYYGGAKKLLSVPKAVFSPRPAVDSVLVDIVLDRALPCAPEREQAFLNLARKAFSAPRKQIGAIFSSQHDVLRAISGLGLDLTARPGDLSVEDYRGVASILMNS